MGYRSRYSGYVARMNKDVGAKCAITPNKSSIKDRIHAMKEKSKKGAK